jgi:hypothetical protein
MKLVKVFLIPVAVITASVYAMVQARRAVKELLEDEDSTIQPLLGVVRPADDF